MLIGKGGALPFTYQGYELECPSLPYVETGDLLSLTTIDDKTYELFVITHELKFAAGAFTSHMKAAIPSSDSINAVESSSGAITGALTIATTKILQVNKLVADTIEATNAKFDDLEVRKANLDELNATKAKIDTLETKSITTDNLAAKVANINTLTAEDAIIKNISAQVINTDVIKAAVADVGYVTAEEVNAAVTNSEKIKAIDAEITNIKAETADITLLKASQAAINTLVTGSAEISAASVIQLRNEYNTTKTNVDGLTEFTKTYFEESADGKFIIGKGVGSDYARMVLDTEEIQFVNANNEVTAYFGNDGFATKKGILTEGNLTIGNFAFMPRENGSLDFKKIN